MKDASSRESFKTNPMTTCMKVTMLVTSLIFSNLVWAQETQQSALDSLIDGHQSVNLARSAESPAPRLNWRR